MRYKKKLQSGVQASKIWESQEKHQEQFEKPYIKKFAIKLEHLMADSCHAFRAELMKFVR